MDSSPLRRCAWLVLASSLMACGRGDDEPAEPPATPPGAPQETAGETKESLDALEEDVAETIVELRAQDRGVAALTTEAVRTYVRARLEDVERAVAGIEPGEEGAEHLVDRVGAARRQIEQELAELEELDPYELEEAHLRIARSLARIEEHLARAGYPVEGSQPALGGGGEDEG